MKIEFFIRRESGQCPVKDFIEQLEVRDRAKILACLKHVESHGFDSPRVQFRHIRGRLWEMKIQSPSGGFRIFYVGVTRGVLVLLHAYQKQSQKAPLQEIKKAENRLNEVLQNEEDYA